MNLPTVLAWRKRRSQPKPESSGQMQGEKKLMMRRVTSFSRNARNGPSIVYAGKIQTGPLPLLRMIQSTLWPVAAARYTAS